MAKSPEPVRAATPKAHVLVIWEDTHDDGPRTFSVARGLVDVDAVELLEHDPQNNSGMARAKALRLIDELDLT